MVPLFELNFLLNLFPILREFLFTDVQLFLRQKDGVVILSSLLDLLGEGREDERIGGIETPTILVGGGLVHLFVSSLTRVQNFESSDGPIDVLYDVGLDLVFCVHSVVFYL